jgi:predicted translin family RNA/ssDNA-binding protein
MSTDPTPTIIDLKLAFLQRQIQALSQPITLPRNYKPEDEDHALRQKSINDALEKVNLKLREHNHLVYSAQAQRHVAEQIDALYWRSAERAAEGMESEGSLQVGMDFSMRYLLPGDIRSNC